MIGQTIGELLNTHVTLDVEGIDRLYLNAYQPRLQIGSGVAYFFRMHRGAAVASTMLMAPMSHAFVTAIEALAKREQIDVVHCHAHQNKDEETQRRLALARLQAPNRLVAKAHQRVRLCVGATSRSGRNNPPCKFDSCVKSFFHYSH